MTECGVKVFQCKEKGTKDKAVFDGALLLLLVLPKLLTIFMSLTIKTSMV